MSVDAYEEHQFCDYNHFFNFIIKKAHEAQRYIWRGQGSDTWILQSSLEREIIKYYGGFTHINAHEKNYKYAIRGRRNRMVTNTDDTDVFKLGRHYGLLTPYLDWTDSPFVAAYFAYYDEIFTNMSDEEPRVAIFGLYEQEVKNKSEEIMQSASKDQERRLTVSIDRPICDDNERLISQSALFTRGPLLSDIKTWVENNFTDRQDIPVLIKCTIPYKDREPCLRALNLMNINHATLFPDLGGAATYCNMKLRIQDY